MLAPLLRTGLAPALFAALSCVLSCSRASPAVDAPAPPPSASLAPASLAPSPPSATSFHGRTIAEPMGYGGAAWLVRDDRASSEEPERVLDALKLAPGMRVADVGAGVGYFTLRLARRLAPGGLVYATDINPQMLAALQARLADAGVTGVTTILCTEDDARLPAGALDLELLVDVYHELARPAATLAQLRAALRTGGRLVLVEYRGDDPDVGIKPEHTMTVAQVKQEVEPAGFRLVRIHEFLSKQRIFEFELAPHAN